MYIMFPLNFQLNDRRDFASLAIKPGIKSQDSRNRIVKKYLIYLNELFPPQVACVVLSVGYVTGAMAAPDSVPPPAAGGVCGAERGVRDGCHGAGGAGAAVQGRQGQGLALHPAQVL